MGNPSHQHLLSRPRRYAALRREDALEIQRIGGRDRRQLARGAVTPQLAEELDRFRQRVLFPGETRDESAAAELAAQLHPAIDADQLAPWDRDALAEERS